MSEYFHIAPWYNSKEWHEVYTKIYEESSKQEALNHMYIWKARCPSLPAGIESTLTLLEVHLQDINCSNDISKDQFLRLAYSSAIMRFVNHMLDTETAKGSSLYQAAKNLEVPDWIIDLRHDTAHSNNLPSLELLREASLIGLNWLKKNYWDKYKTCIKDYTTCKISSETNEDKINVLINFCTCLSICLNNKIKNLSDISDTDMQNSIISDARELFGENIIDLSNLKTVSIMSLVNIMHSHSKKLLKGKYAVSQVIKTLLEEDSVFLSLELVHYLSDYEFVYKKRLSQRYVQCFELLLTFLHTNDLLLEFIKELVQITRVNDDKNKCLLAALWLCEILKALRKSKMFVDKMNRIKSSEMNNKKRKELKSLFHHWFPNENMDCLILDLQKSVPPALLNMSFVQPIISSYNIFLTYFIADLLNLIEPPLQKSVKDKICKLANMISSPEKLTSFPPSKIYTVDDIPSEVQSSTVKEITTMEQSAENDNKPMDFQVSQTSEEQAQCQKQNQPACGIWKLSIVGFNWATCPIGQPLN